MTDLQLGLLVIGAAAVAAVLLYNRVQERSARRHAERAFGARHADVLLDAPQARREPVLETVHRAPPAQGQALPDARADYVITLKAPRAIALAAALEIWKPLERRFARRAVLATAEGAASRRLAAGDAGTAAGLQAALQMVSRDGAVGEAQLLEFRSAVETLAAKLGASASAPQMRPALEAARELDRLCAETDIQVALHVVGSFFTNQLDIKERTFQVVERPDGLTLTLDVARTAEPARAYEAMARAARQLAASGGRLVDDHGKPVDERGMAAIGVQIELVRGMLAEHGIQPGDALALRLFS